AAFDGVGLGDDESAVHGAGSLREAVRRPETGGHGCRMEMVVVPPSQGGEAVTLVTVATTDVMLSDTPEICASQRPVEPVVHESDPR
ncbi:MAG: hypothetical protein KDB63_22710, partial [Nocardioidaceae bacterium]|nr:hypothetical protein [Nocardioidaceae bacterium]